MPNTTPRPCWHTGFAIVAVLLAGLALGAFAKPEARANGAANAAPVMAPAER